MVVHKLKKFVVIETDHDYNMLLANLRCPTFDVGKVQITMEMSKKAGNKYHIVVGKVHSITMEFRSKGRQRNMHLHLSK